MPCSLAELTRWVTDGAVFAQFLPISSQFPIYCVVVLDPRWIEEIVRKDIEYYAVPSCPLSYIIHAGHYFLFSSPPFLCLYNVHCYDNTLFPQLFTTPFNLTQPKII